MTQKNPETPITQKPSSVIHILAVSRAGSTQTLQKFRLPAQSCCLQCTLKICLTGLSSEGTFSPSTSTFSSFCFQVVKWFPSLSAWALLSFATQFFHSKFSGRYRSLSPHTHSYVTRHSFPDIWLTTLATALKFYQ